MTTLRNHVDLPDSEDLGSGDELKDLGHWSHNLDPGLNAWHGDGSACGLFAPRLRRRDVEDGGFRFGRKQVRQKPDRRARSAEAYT